MGLFETATGLGYLIGPLLGSALYKFGGHLAAFYGYCGINIILYPAMAMTADHIDTIFANSIQNGSERISDNNSSRPQVMAITG